MAYQFEQLGTRSGPHHRFVRRAEGREHARHAILRFLLCAAPLLAFGYFHPQRQDLRDAAQKLHHLGAKLAGILAKEVRDDADRLPFAQEGKGCGFAQAGALGQRTPQLEPVIVKHVFADTVFACTKCMADQPLALRDSGIGGWISLGENVRQLAGTSHRIKP